MIFLLKLNNWNLLMPSSTFLKEKMSQFLNTIIPENGRFPDTRLRTNCSSVNIDLFVKNISDSPICTCGSIEDSQHYFFNCVNYRRQRTELLNEISRYSNPSLHLLLNGNQTIPLETNVFTFQAVHKYISSTQRFNNFHGPRMRAYVSCAPAPIICVEIVTHLHLFFFSGFIFVLIFLSFFFFFFFSFFFFFLFFLLFVVVFIFLFCLFLFFVVVFFVLFCFSFVFSGFF